ncbi:MAG: acetate--CoA ligase [Candidatus Gracilibacteria bacterium]|nr:acetate--CoA ligase [Candidatus Gracilibacteria bacterium]
MKKDWIYPSKKFVAQSKLASFKLYQKMYRESLENPEKFWSQQAAELFWFKKWDKVYSWKKSKLELEFFAGGKLNACYNCLDRHLDKNADKLAVLWEGDEPGESRKFTYKELFTEVCKFANVLKKHGVKKGNKVCFYMPMVPELLIGILACARIGAIHSVIFGGFSAESLAERINDSRANLLVTSNVSLRNGKSIPMKQNIDADLKHCKSLKKVIVFERKKLKTPMQLGRDFWWQTEMQKVSEICQPAQMNSEDILFILYTSGTTGKPKGVVHSTAGYLLQTALSFKYIFDHQKDDIFWCTADIGWITGHSYLAYGPFLNAATIVMFEGVPTYPAPDRFWQIIDKYQVTVFYTAPTVIRLLSKFGDDLPKKYALKSLRLLGSVGEPINPQAWLWYHNIVGRKRCPIVDTWWQTETGSILITTLPGAMPMKPGAAGLPFFGVEPEVRDEKGKKLKDKQGLLVIKKPWPSMLRTVYKDPKRFRKTYFSHFKDTVYFTGDGAKCDEDGYFWITGRVDDVINVAGHRIGTAEVESALVSHKAVAEAAVVGINHEIKGQALYAFVTVKKGYLISDNLIEDLRQQVAKEIGPIAKPDIIQFAEGLPKTRSGKIMRRILKAIANNEPDLGNTTTLADPDVVSQLVAGHKSL